MTLLHFQVDVEGLNKQIEEKKQQEEEQKKIEEAYLKKQIRDSEIAKRLERQLDEVDQNLKF